jgi:two-component system OmpR family response regulator
MQMRLLLVEYDGDLATRLGCLLRQQGYAVDAVATGEEALFRAKEFGYDVIVLEASGPNDDGPEVCSRLRKQHCWAPLVMLTDNSDVRAMVRGLDGGADDYLRRPFDPIELFARLRAVTRRDLKARPAVLQVGDLMLDPATRRVERAGEKIDLSAKEFALLEEFMRRPGDALSRSHLIEHVWDFAYDGGSNVVDVYIRYLRDKVDRPFGRESIKTVRAVGYRLDPQG